MDCVIACCSLWVAQADDGVVILGKTVGPGVPLEDVEDVVVANLPDVKRLLFKLAKAPLLLVVVLYVEDLVAVDHVLPKWHPHVGLNSTI